MSDPLLEYLSFVRPWDDASHKVVTYSYWDQNSNERRLAKRGFVDLQAAANFIRWKDNSGEDVWFSAQKFRINPAAEAQTSRSGTVSYKRPNRDARSVEEIYCFHADMDVKPGAYPDLQSAINALFAFCANLNMPPPSMCVCSGYGLHSYWRVDTPMTPAQWSPVAQALRNAMQQAGIHADHSVTIDTARILRPAGTRNFKVKEDPKWTYIVPGSSMQLYPLQWIADPLKAYMGPQLATVHGKLVAPGAIQFKHTVNSNLSAGVGMGSSTVDLMDIAKSCAVIHEEFHTRGAHANEPLWNLIAVAAAFDINPGPTFEALSDGHPGYDPVKTLQKLQDKEQRIQNGTLGWPQCSAFLGLGGAVASKCLACPHLAANKSPLNLTSRPKPAAGALPGADPDLPSQYWQNPDGSIWTVQTDTKTGGQVDTCVLNYIVRDGFVEDITNDIIFTSTSVAGREISVRIKKEKSADIRGELHRHGLFTQENDAGKIGRFFMAWATHLRNIGKIEKYVNMGWSPTGFVHGDMEWNGSVGTRVTLEDESIMSVYGVKGDPAPWQRMRDMILANPNPATHTLLSVGFAAPLIALGGLPAVLLTPYSRASATGKSTALSTACAMWGQYVQGMYSTDDTDAYVKKRMSSSPNFPAIWDEIPPDERVLRGVVRVAFQLGQGRDKGRLHATTDVNTGKAFQTLMVAASNLSLAERITRDNDNSNAGMMRAFEIRMPEITPQEAKLANSGMDVEVMRNELKNNYGHAGAAYAQYLTANKQGCQDMIHGTLKHLKDTFGEDSRFRFWYATIASLVCGARFAQLSGLANLDAGMIYRFLVKEMEFLKHYGDDMVQDIGKADSMGLLLREVETSGKVLFTTGMVVSPGSPVSVNLRGQTSQDIARLHDAWAQRSETPDMLRVEKRPFENWLVEKGRSPREVLDQLQNRYGAQIIRTTLGAGIVGWPHDRRRITCLDIPMAQFN